MLTVSLVLIAVVLLFTVVPVMVGARIVGAGRDGFWMCLLALIVSFVIVRIAAHMLHGGALLAFFVAPVGFMLILDTTYLRGLVMVVLQYLIAFGLVLLLLFTALGTTLHVKDTVRGLTGMDSPAQPI